MSLFIPKIINKFQKQSSDQEVDLDYEPKNIHNYLKKILPVIFFLGYVISFIMFKIATTLPNEQALEINNISFILFILDAWFTLTYLLLYSVEFIEEFKYNSKVKNFTHIKKYKNFNKFNTLYNQICSESSNTLQDLSQKYGKLLYRRKYKNFNHVRRTFIFKFISSSLKYRLIFFFIFPIFMLYFPSNILSFLTLLVIYMFFITTKKEYQHKLKIELEDYKNTENYKNVFIESYKEKIIAKFIKLVNEDFNYTTSYQNLQEIADNYANADFLYNDNLSSFNRLQLDDYIDGYLSDDCFIQISDIHIQSIIKVSGYENIQEIFQGLFVTSTTKFDTNNSYVRIFLKKDFLLDLINSEKIELDNDKFNKIFNVSSNNKIMATRILTADLMEELIEFNEYCNLKYEIVMKDKKIYLRFFTGPMFEPLFCNTIIDKKSLYTYYYIFNFVCSITEKINKALSNID